MTVTTKGACITAAGTICAGILAGLISLCTHNNTPPSSLPAAASKTEGEPHPATADRQTERKPDPANAQLVALLKSRAADVFGQLSKERGEILDIQDRNAAKERHKDAANASPSANTERRRLRSKQRLLGENMSDVDVTAALAEISDGLEHLAVEFLELHRAHIEALSNDHTTIAHEIHGKIQRLLLVKHRAIYEDAGGDIPSELLMYVLPPPIRIGSWEAYKVDLSLQNKYPLDSSTN